MKVYISADMEGISGISSKEFLTPGSYEYERGRKLLMNDINAAVKGALDAGATEVLVNDAHGCMRNVLIEDLHEKAELISGYPKPDLMICGLDETFDAAIFVGYHTKNDALGLLSHTISGNLFRSITLNNKTYGEYGINAAMAGHFNVPVVFVSGDNYLELEVKDICPNTTYVTTKQAITQVCARLKSPKAVKEEIEKQVKFALENKDKISPLRLGKIKAKIEVKLPVQTEIAINIPTIERTGPTSFTFEAGNIIEAYKVITAIFNSSCVMSIGMY